MHRTHRWPILAATALAATALTFSSIGAVAQDESPAASEAAAPAATGMAELDQAMAGELAGTQVTIQTQWRGAEGEGFAAAVQPFIDATGIRVVPDIIGTSHETVLRSRVEGGAPPDTAILAQPAAIIQYGQEGSLIDIASFMDADAVAADHAATVGLYQDGDSLWGIPYKVDVKAVIWYPIPAFEAAGYEIPETWDELIAIADAIVADGGAPFCVGIGAGTATGWQTTDLVEATLLRTAGPEAYDQWISHELPFNSPEVKAAMDLAAQIYFTPGYVLGGNTAITALDQTTPMDPMFQGPDGQVGTEDDDLTNPGCWMHIIPFWYGPDFFPDQRATPGSTSKFIVGEDVGVFPMPPVDPAQNPALGSGDALIVFQDRPEVRAFAQYLSTPQGIEAWTKLSGAVSANTTVPPEWYEGQYEAGIAAGLLANATDFRFDASDIMPAAVGAGSFWTGMVDWIAANGENTEEVLQAIDDSWPS
jgi:alpha-glucoside transport system substrate-binding protein